MKKLARFYLIISFSILLFANSLFVNSYAEPRKMPDGQLFDAQFYSESYPDVVNAFGKSEAALYRHYVKYGKKEGRLPYAGADIKALEEKDEAFPIKKCVLMIGDSRTCGLIATIAKNPEYQKLYQYSKDKVYDAIYMRGDTVFVFCAEGGGRFCEGAYTRSVDRLLKIVKTNEIVKNTPEYVAINMYGYNDLKVPAEDFTWPQMYIASDENLKAELGPKCKRFYQFNSGPINEGGLAFLVDGINNNWIKQYNKSFVRTRNIVVIDFYGYLIRNGYASNNEEDAEGVHYDYDTNLKIWRLIYSII